MIVISSFGQRLKAERERQGFDLDAVAEGTKIRKLYLNALEEDDFSQLPPRVYATGFVASYARFLGMEVETAVQEFKALAYPVQPDPQPEITAVPKKKVRKRIVRRGRNRKIPMKSIFAALVFLAIIWWLGSYLAAYIGQQGVKQAPIVENAPTSQVSEIAPSSPPVNTAADRLNLIISAEQRCWLQVEVDGVNKYTGTMAGGEKLSFEGRTTIVVRAGNAGGIVLTLNGKKLASLGAVGQVVEKKYDISSITKE